MITLKLTNSLTIYNQFRYVQNLHSSSTVLKLLNSCHLKAAWFFTTLYFKFYARSLQWMHKLILQKNYRD